MPCLKLVLPVLQFHLETLATATTVRSDSGSDQEEDIVDTEPNTGASQKVCAMKLVL